MAQQLQNIYGMTLRQAVAFAADRLSTQPELAGHAIRDAELLLLYTLGLPRTTIYAYPSRLLSEAEGERFDAVIERRLRAEPVQYITGRQEFFGLDLRVTPATLIPRPETELLVETVLQELAAGPASPRIADVGTGSGAIAIALATRLPRARLLAIDLSSPALAVARENAAAHCVKDRIEFRPGDLLDGLSPGIVSLDAIVSNPPYVPLRDRASLHPEVREHEPASALFAGEDGLDIYRRLIPAAARILGPRGFLALEFGFGQRDALAELLAGWVAVSFLLDLQGIPRVAVAFRP